MYLIFCFFFFSLSGWCSAFEHLHLITVIQTRGRSHHTSKSATPAPSRYVLANSGLTPHPWPSCPSLCPPPCPHPSSPLLMWWFLVVAPVASFLAWWAACIMAAQAQSETFTLLPPLLASPQFARPPRSAVCPSIHSSADDAGLSATPSASPGHCRLPLEWTALSAPKMSRQRLSRIKPLPSLHLQQHQLHQCRVLHQSCWSALCAYCVMHGTASQTSWHATTALVQTACDSICASRSQSPELTSAALSAQSASTPTIFGWSWGTGPLWRSMRSSCWGGGWWLSRTAAGALPLTVGKN